MLASNNILSPATGRPIVTPSQDMVLGCYYLTAENPVAQKGSGRYFANFNDAVIAYEQGVIHLHSYIWVRFDGEVENVEAEGDPKVETLANGSVSKEYKFRRVREDKDGVMLSQYIRTTAGRIIYHQTIQSAINS